MIQNDVERELQEYADNPEKYGPPSEAPAGKRWVRRMNVTRQAEGGIVDGKWVPCVVASWSWELVDV